MQIASIVANKYGEKLSKLAYYNLEKHITCHLMI